MMVFSWYFWETWCENSEAGLPAVGTRGLFLLETRIGQEVNKTASTHQVSIGTLTKRQDELIKMKRHWNAERVDAKK